jgi:hypothetical protein
MDEPVGVGVWRKKDQNGNWISEKSEFDPEASKRRADHLDHFLKLPSFQQRYELEVKSRDSVRDARKCAGMNNRAAEHAQAWSSDFHWQMMQLVWRQLRAPRRIARWS